MLILTKLPSAVKPALNWRSRSRACAFRWAWLSTKSLHARSADPSERRSAAVPWDRSGGTGRRFGIQRHARGPSYLTTNLGWGGPHGHQHRQRALVYFQSSGEPRRAAEVGVRACVIAAHPFHVFKQIVEMLGEEIGREAGSSTERVGNQFLTDLPFREPRQQPEAHHRHNGPW